MYKVGDLVELKYTILTTIKTRIVKIHEYTDVWNYNKKFYRYECSHNPNIYYSQSSIVGYAKQE